MPSSRARRALLAGLTGTALLVPATLVHGGDRGSQQTNGSRETTIATLAAADGRSDNTTFSQDNRMARLMGYDSAATNLVSGDSNGKRDVFVRTRGADEESIAGTTARVSVSTKGSQSNGDSTEPSIDGDTKRSPHCVTFQSTATNLDRADRSSDSDIFLRDLRRHTTTLVSAGSTNARHGVVDGECEFVTYEAGGRVIVRDLEDGKSHTVGRGSSPDQQTSGKGVAYERGGQIYYQAFQKVFNKGNPIVKTMARELLVSAGRSGRGNGRSSNASMDDNGHYVAFESTATNLCPGLCSGVSSDANGAVSDIYRATISSKAPTDDRMQMASYSEGKSLPTYPDALKLQGNGPSNNPAMTGAGENISYDSAATNLRQHSGIKTVDPNGPERDIYYWNFPRKRMYGNVSRESKPGSELTTDDRFYNGASTNPASSSRANFIAFTSSETGLSGESNGGDTPDVFMRYLGGGPEGE